MMLLKCAAIMEDEEHEQRRDAGLHLARPVGNIRLPRDGQTFAFPVYKTTRASTMRFAETRRKQGRREFNPRANPKDRVSRKKNLKPAAASTMQRAAVTARKSHPQTCGNLP